MAVIRAFAVIVVLLLVAPFVAGMTLPSRYEGRATLDSRRSPDEVWEALTAYEKNPVTGAALKRFERLPDQDGRPQWSEDLGETKIRVAVAELSPPARLVLRMVDEKVPVSAEVEIGVQPKLPGSRIGVRWTTEVRSGSWITPLFRLAMKLQGGAEASARGYLSRLAANLGEAPPPGAAGR